MVGQVSKRNGFKNDFRSSGPIKILYDTFEEQTSFRTDRMHKTIMRHFRSFDFFFLFEMRSKPRKILVFCFLAFFRGLAHSTSGIYDTAGNRKLEGLSRRTS